MVRLLCIFALLASVLATAACGEREEPSVGPNPTDAPEFEITGRWSGELTQQGMRPFRVQARIASLERFKQNTVHYTEIDCSGTWEYLGASTTAYRFREVIDRGESAKCKGTGTVSLTPTGDDAVDYEFRGAGVTSSGELERVFPAN